MGATYIECSSKEMRGVDQVFELAVNTAVEAEENMCSQRLNPTAGGGEGGVKTGIKVKKRSCKIL